MPQRAALAVVVGLVSLAVAVGLTGRPAVGAQSVTVTPAPCAPTAGACTVHPGTLTVGFPGGVPVGVDAVSVAWSTAGRPAGSPAPPQTAVTLLLSDGACNATACAWPWPDGLKDAGAVLNGSYQVTPCSTAGPPTSTSSTSTSTTSPPTTAPPGSAGTSDATSCSPAGSLGGAGTSVAARPASPAGLSVRSPSAAANSPVTVVWTRGTSPDLAGYEVSRGATVIGICTMNGATVGGAAACGAAPALTDARSGSGPLTYAVTAISFGVAGGFSGGVPSTPTAATLTLQAAGTIAPLNPVPVVGTPVIPKAVVPPSAAVTAPGATTSTTANPEPGPLNYGGGTGAPPLHSASAATHGGTPHGVGGIALVAAGLLVLAAAGHLAYLRLAVARYQAAHGGPAPAAAEQDRGRMRWGGWPPVRRRP